MPIHVYDAGGWTGNNTTTHTDSDVLQKMLAAQQYAAAIANQQNVLGNQVLGGAVGGGLGQYYPPNQAQPAQWPNAGFPQPQPEEDATLLLIKAAQMMGIDTGGFGQHSHQTVGFTILSKILIKIIEKANIQVMPTAEQKDMIDAVIEAKESKNGNDKGAGGLW